MSRVYAGDARLMAELATERRIFVPYSAVPDVVKQAFVSAEDQNFWLHRGVDPLAIVRAATFDLTHMGQGRRPVGASTITQQVAKNMLLDNQVSLARKAREAILAMRIEQNLPKERILELYLNEIYLGMGSYGVVAAAQAYFNKPLDKLTLPEAAFLAALPKAPNNYNPFRFPDAAKGRRDWVLDRMAEDRVITAAQAASAKAEAIIPSEFHRPQPIPGADWFAEEVRRELIARFGADVTTQGGLMVRTSLDPALQATAEKAVRDGLMAYDRKMGGWRGPVAHLDGGTSLAKEWAGPLSQVARPPGMLPDWKLAVVLDASDTEARLGWLDPTGQAAGQAPQQRLGALALSDLAWARPVRDGRPGVAPRRIADVVQQGDVVMVEPGPVAPAAQSAPPVKGVASDPRGKPAPLRRLALRQIPTVQGALVSLDPTTGRVLAMVGGWSFEGSQFNRTTQAQRQPGSSFKPFVYLTALEKGVSPSQRFLDAPMVMDMGAAGRWRPNNYEMEFGGPTPLRIALERSLNLVTLHVAQSVGMEAIAQTAIAFHEVEAMPRVLPAALGAVDTTVLREAGAYASLAEGGHEVIPTLIDSVQDRDGHVVWRPSPIQCGDCTDQANPPQLDRPAQGDCRSGQRVPARHHDAGCDDARHRSAGGGWARTSDRRQDRHDAGLHRCLVLWLHAGSGDHGMGRLRQPRHARQQGDRLGRRRADLARFHGRRVEEPSGADLPAAARRDDGDLGHGERRRDGRVQAGSGARRLPTARRRGRQRCLRAAVRRRPTARGRYMAGSTARWAGSISRAAIWTPRASDVSRIRRPERTDQAVRRAAEEASLTGMSPRAVWPN